jgi:nitroreductase
MDESLGALGMTRRQVDEVIATAGLAPSLHNSQPWRFRVGRRSIALFADRERRLPAIDPDDRELRMGCGAALFTLRLALLGQGVRPLVTLLPDRGDPDLLAVVRSGGRRGPTPEQQRLLAAVPRRRTNRHPFADTAVGLPEQYALRRAAQEEGAWLHVVADPDERQRLRELAATAHRRQTADPAFRAELERWTAAEAGRPDGVPASAGGPAPTATNGWIHRDFTGGAATPLASGRTYEPEPLIAVLTSHLAGPMGDLQAGQALQRVLLTATADGLAVSPLSQVVEVLQTREQLRHLLRSARPPHAVLRIGRGWPVPATPRRRVVDVLDPHDTPDPETVR